MNEAPDPQDPRIDATAARDAEPSAPLTAAAGDGAPLQPEAEQSLWTGRTHWHYFVGRMAVALVAILLAWWLISGLSTRFQWTGRSALLIAAIVTLVIVLGVVVSMALQIMQYRYRLTDQRLFIEKGILSQTIDQSELIRVDDVRVHKRLVDRILGLGSLEIRSTDASHQAIHIRGVKHPEPVAELVRTRMRNLRSRSLFVEKL